jgi:hypothetical protein
MHAIAITPAELLGACFARFPRSDNLPHHLAGSASALDFSSLLSVHSRYGLHDRQVPFRTFYTEGFSRFVASTTAPIATGWSESAGWDSHPLKDRAFARRTKRFVEYLLELSDGVTGRIIEVLRRAAFQALADKSQKVGLQQLQHVGARMPSVIGRRQ